MQRLLLLLISTVSLLVALSSIRYIYKKIKLKRWRSHDIIISEIGFVFLIFSIISIIFAADSFKFTEQKFIVYLSLLVFSTVILLILMLSKIQKNNRILYPLSFVLLSIIPAIINIKNIHLVIPVSLLVAIMTFLSFTEDHKSHITMLIAFSSISLIFYIFSIVFPRLMLLFSVISLSIFLVFITEFMKFLTTKKDVHLHENKKSNSRIIPFVRHLVFIIIITSFIFVGTVAVHELGHAISAQASDCEHTTIVYELAGLPHTEINCSDTSDSRNWILLGVFFPIIIAMLLMFSGGKSVKELSLEIVGFSLLISYMDFLELGSSIIFAKIIVTIGIILSLSGLILLVRSRTDY